MSSLCQRPEYVQTATVVLFAEQVVFSYQREEESYVLKDWLVFQIGKEKKKQKNTTNIHCASCLSYNGAEIYGI